MKTLLLALAAILAWPSAAPAPDPPARTAWMKRACAAEDGLDCFWNAAQQGDHHGHSFYVRHFPRGPTCTMYVDPGYARTHDRCG